IFPVDILISTKTISVVKQEKNENEEDENEEKAKFYSISDSEKYISLYYVIIDSYIRGYNSFIEFMDSIYEANKVFLRKIPEEKLDDYFKYIYDINLLKDKVSLKIFSEGLKDFGVRIYFI